MPVKRRPSGQHHGDLRNALERATLALVAKRGPHGFTLAEACRRAGVSVAAPYKHFADRDALLAALAVKGYEEQLRRYRAAISLSSDPVEQLAAFAVAYVRFAVERREVFAITFLAGLDTRRHPELVVAGRRLHELLMPITNRIVEHPEDAFDIFVRIAASAHGLALYFLNGMLPPGHDRLERIETQAASTARAIAGDGARPRSPRAQS